MTVVTFHVTDEVGNNISGISIKGVVDWGGPLGIGAGNQSFNVVTNDSGNATEDNGNGMWAGGGSYTAVGSGFQTITGEFNISGGVAAQTVPIVMLATSGSTSTPQLHTPTGTYLLIGVAVVSILVAIGFAVVKR